MRYVKYVLVCVLMAMLAACGGGGNPGTTSGGSGDTASKVAAVEIFASAASLDSASLTGVSITAVVKDKNNNALSGESFSFSATSGVLQASSTTTTAAGLGVATLTPGSDRSNRNISVTVTAGLMSKTLIIPVLGSSMAVNGSSSLVSGASASYVVSLKDSAGAAIPNVGLTVASSLGNTLSANALTTSSTGSASFTYTAVNSGSDVITVTGGGISTQYAVSISSLNFAFITPSSGADVAVSSPQSVQVRLLSSGVAVSGATINFSATRGSIGSSAQITDVNGDAFTTITSTTAGPSTITAQIAGGAQTRLAVNFVASSPASIVVQSNISTVAPNVAPSTANAVALTAIVKDAAGNPVKNQIVNFNLNPDPSGGILASGSAVTDANGTVTDSFIPGPSSTATNGVTIVASVSGTSITGSTTLTVSSSALFINFFVSNTITNLNASTYSKPFVVSVTDAAGAAVSGKTVSLSVYPTFYYKGQLGTSAQRGSATAGWGVLTSQQCANEDVNRNGTLDSGEDTSTDGFLTPGGPGVVSTSTVTTDASGQASFDLYYGENYAPWVMFEITASALVSGTESKAKLNYGASVLASDWTDETVTPAGRLSPFGTVLNCSSPN